MEQNLTKVSLPDPYRASFSFIAPHLEDEQLTTHMLECLNVLVLVDSFISYRCRLLADHLWLTLLNYALHFWSTWKTESNQETFKFQEISNTG